MVVCVAVDGDIDVYVRCIVTVYVGVCGGVRGDGVVVCVYDDGGAYDVVVVCCVFVVVGGICCCSDGIVMCDDGVAVTNINVLCNTNMRGTVINNNNNNPP